MRLDLKDLAFGYGRRKVGGGVTLALDSGEVLSLLGPNGSGKTTLFKTILGLLPPLAGQVLLDGEDIARWDRRRFARIIGYVPQATTPGFSFTVRELVLMGRTARMPTFATPSATDHVAAERALDVVGIRHLATRDITRISGGERQLALIARALAGEPAFLVLDEPTASLDFGNQVRVLRAIRTLSRQGLGIILSTHHPDQAFACGGRAALLSGGSLVEAGPTGSVLTSERLSRLYGVDVDVADLDGRGVCLPRYA